MPDLHRFVTPAPSREPVGVLVAQASECLDRFTAAFNACDLAGMDAQLHFPHVMLSGAEPLIWPGPGQHPADFFERLQATGWAFTQYEQRDVVLVNADKVHFTVHYTRRSATGEVLSRHQNLWIVTRIDGHWGIALRSY